MVQVPRSIQNLIEAFERLPGIGPKTAQRLTYYLLHAPITEAKALAEAALGMKEKTKVCSVCFNIGEEDLCRICSDSSRNKEVIAVELQAEPWCPNLVYDCELAEQEKTMNLEQFKKNIEFARNTGLKEFYLWGGEWWYWLKEKQNNPEIWDEARKLFTESH